MRNITNYVVIVVLVCSVSNIEFELLPKKAEHIFHGWNELVGFSSDFNRTKSIKSGIDLIKLNDGFSHVFFVDNFSCVYYFLWIT